MSPRFSHTLPLSARHRTIALVLLIFQITGLLGIAGHTHEFALRLITDPAVTTHSCGANERHIPLDAIPRCPACWQIHQRNAVPSAPFVSIAVLVQRVRVCDPDIVPVTDHLYLLPQKRGPPVVA
jgi:hypothetical protein